MSDKQRWVYTEKGPQLEKNRPKVKDIKLRKSYFVAPWIIIAGLIIWAISSGGFGSVLVGILLLIFAPLIGLAINAMTFYFIVIRPFRIKK